MDLPHQRTEYTQLLEESAAHAQHPLQAHIGAMVKGVDLFCGAGGLTHGLETAGIDMKLGIDIDPICAYPYSENNRASFLLQSVGTLSASVLHSAFKGASIRLLAGCAPCQPFSTYSQRRPRHVDKRWNLLVHFGRLVKETRPHLVTMENVPLLERQEVFLTFVRVLKEQGFEIFHDVINCADYGVPQHRRRLVLLASRLGSISMIEPVTPEGQRITVRKAIENQPPLHAGQECESDPLHRACELSPLNLKRIRASRPGGTWRDWDVNLRAECHRKSSGKTYPSVYGRMRWDHLSPTITTQYYGFGNGRFGHPEQDRAISLREGAILQSFPEHYKLLPDGEPVYRKKIGSMIGNAVPVELARAIGEGIVRHVGDWIAVE